ncbi:MAG TPA: polysaccharide deacetylase family protein, partial [Flavisolibacter sp.]|nr:polysaccharide deacetylase family protein [Flavisolibacter sp.]
DKKTLSFKKYAAITFDDGYIDNYITARPLLEQYGLPATFFITHQNIDMSKEFWWDELERIILHRTDLPSQLQVKISGEEFKYQTDPYKESSLILAYFQNPLSNVPNLDLYINLWKRLLPLPALQQQQVMNELRIWTGESNIARKEYCCMNAQQLLELSSSDNFEIGVHTASHPALSYHSKEYQVKEIASNKTWLEQLTKRRMRYCAYPYGNYNETTVGILRDLSFDAALTTNAGIVKKDSNCFELGRFQVKNWNGHEFKRHLLSWIKAH